MSLSLIEYCNLQCFPWRTKMHVLTQFWTECPRAWHNFCQVEKSRFISIVFLVLVTHFSYTYRMLVFTFSYCTRSYTKRLIDFLTGLLYYEDVYIVIAINLVHSLQHGRSL